METKTRKEAEEQTNRGPSCGSSSSSSITTHTKKPTLKRYVVLLLFCLNSGNKAFQWIQIPASTIKATRLYGVDNYVINFTSIIFMLNFLVLSWPSCLIIERIGMRKAVLVASLGTVVGSIVKCASCTHSGVLLLLLGQILVSLSEQLIFSLPTRLASVWFPDHEVSFAVAMCILGNQLGIAVGFMVPQWFLEGAESELDIGWGFYRMFQATLVYSGALFLLNLLLFDEAPRHAPGAARAKQIQLERQQTAERTSSEASPMGRIKDLFKQSLMLCKNRDLMLVALVYGISFGRGDAISTLLDQTMKPIYPGNDALIGLTGCLIIIAGAIGAPLWGRAMDLYHAYKRINIILSICTTAMLVLFAYAMIQVQSESLVYLTAVLFGFFQTGFMVACLELAIELTYPAPELITSSLLNCMPSAIGPLFIWIGSFIVDNFGALALNLFFLATLLVAFVLISVVHEKLKRQAARQTERPKAVLEIASVAC